jgi:hypothetical protein
MASVLLGTGAPALVVSLWSVAGISSGAGAFGLFSLDIFSPYLYPNMLHVVFF